MAEKDICLETVRRPGLKGPAVAEEIATVGSVSLIRSKADISILDCGQAGHRSRDCPNPAQASSGY